MSQNKNYIVCDECFVTHFSNCGTCFGFGVKEKIFGITNNIPISSDDAMSIVLFGKILMWDYCPECHSSPYGIPAKANV